jgi:hypothetical protein
MGVDEFFKLTPVQYFGALQLKNEEKYNDIIFQKEQNRVLSFFTVTPHLGKNSSIKKPADLYSITADENTISSESLDLLMAETTAEELEIISKLISS